MHWATSRYLLRTKVLRLRAIPVRKLTKDRFALSTLVRRVPSMDLLVSKLKMLAEGEEGGRM